MPPPAGRRRFALAAMPLLVLAVIAASCGSGEAGAAIKLTQLQSQGGNTLAKFNSPRCTVKRGDGFHDGFTAKDRSSNGWRLTARVYGASFDGFHRYLLEYGHHGSAAFFVSSDDTNTTVFTTENDPLPGGPLPDLTIGGALSFPNHRKVLGIGFPLVYDSATLDPPPQIASLVGKAPCKYGRSKARAGAA